MIIDGHLHYSSRYMDPDLLLKSMDKAGVEKAFLVPYAYENKLAGYLAKLPLWFTQLPNAAKIAERHLHKKMPDARHRQPPNHEIRETVEKFPDRFIGCYWANPENPSCRKELAEYVEQHNFKCLKLHQVIHPCSINSGQVQALFETAQRYRLPVFIHTSSLEELKALLLAARRFPDASFIIAHLGFYTEIYQTAERIPNVFFDISPVSYHTPAALIKAVLTMGSDRLLFGTDIPFPDAHKDGVIKIDHLPFTGCEKASILGDNLQNILRRVKNNVQ